jgi:hypothetical protein
MKDQDEGSKQGDTPKNSPPKQNPNPDDGELEYIPDK